jgi:hypothetical protein
MTQIANLTIKKADGTTDVVWTGARPSGGDKSPAVYENRTVGTAPLHYPRMKVTSQASGNAGQARRTNIDFQWPFLVTDSLGKKTIAKTLPIRVEAPIDQNIDLADITEAVHQFANLLDHADVKAQLIEGFAAV